MHKDVTLKERLVYRRNALNLSQAALADQARLSERSVSDYERGLSQPSLDQLRKLARALDVRLSYLLGEEAIAEAGALQDRPGGVDLIGYSNLETEALEKILADLSSKLRKFSAHERKHVLGNLRSVLDVLEERCLAGDKNTEGTKGAKGDGHVKSIADKTAEALGRRAADEVRKSSS